MGRRFPAKQTALIVQSSPTTLQLHVPIAYRCHFGILLPMWSMFGHSGRCGSVPATPRACRRCGRRRLAAGRKRKARCRCRAASVGLALLLTLCLCVCGATPAVGLIFCHHCHWRFYRAVGIWTCSFCVVRRLLSKMIYIHI